MQKVRRSENGFVVELRTGLIATPGGKSTLDRLARVCREVEGCVSLVEDRPGGLLVDSVEILDESGSTYRHCWVLQLDLLFPDTSLSEAVCTARDFVAMWHIQHQQAAADRREQIAAKTRDTHPSPHY